MILYQCGCIDVSIVYLLFGYRFDQLGIGQIAKQFFHEAITAGCDTWALLQRFDRCLSQD